MKKKVLILLASIMMAFFSAMAEDTYNFTGNVGKYGVKGHITLFGSTIVGDYSYNRSSGKLWLKGSWSKNNNQITMTEGDNKGKESGYWNLVYHPGNRTFTGIMTTRKGKTYDVKLKCR